MIFQNRKHAGELLAQKLDKYKGQNIKILAIPRGGVPVASVISKHLNADLDVLVVRKIGAPFNSEFAIGAICEGDEPVIKELSLARIGFSPKDIAVTIEKQKKEIIRQLKVFRNDQALKIDPENIIIIVDDGLATGSTMSAAIRHLKKMKYKKIVIAVPVASMSSANWFKSQVDDFIALEIREDLTSVGQWYSDFTQVSDEEVVESLRSLKQKEMQSQVYTKNVEIALPDIKISGEMTAVLPMRAFIIFAHGSGSSRRSPRNRQVARILNSFGFGTLLFDLLSDEEASDRKYVFDIDFLSHRLNLVTDWVKRQPDLINIPIGFFGASTGAAAALKASAQQDTDSKIYSIVSRGGRPDLAGGSLKLVKTPTLLLVGSLDKGVLELNKEARSLLSNSRLSIIKDASHLFEEPGALGEVAARAAKWFLKCLRKTSAESEVGKYTDMIF